jgi:uncharacterized protein (UPF0216 family)
MEIDKINNHLPAKPLPLHLLLRMDEPVYKLRDGELTSIDPKEIDRIKELIPNRYWSSVLLPIIIIRRRDLGQSAFTVGGSEQNLYIIQSLFDELPPFEVWKVTAEKNKVFYRPHIREIRKSYPTASVIGFS